MPNQSESILCKVITADTCWHVHWITLYCSCKTTDMNELNTACWYHKNLTFVIYYVALLCRLLWWIVCYCKCEWNMMEFDPKAGLDDDDSHCMPAQHMGLRNITAKVLMNHFHGTNNGIAEEELFKRTRMAGTNRCKFCRVILYISNSSL